MLSHRLRWFCAQDYRLPEWACETRGQIVMKSFPHSPHHETEGSASTGAAKQAPNPAPQAESLLAAEKQTLEKMANGASLSEVLNDLCAVIDAHGSPVTSMVCLLNGEWLGPCAGPHVPAPFKAAITPWRIGPHRASSWPAPFTHHRGMLPETSQ